MVFSLGYAAVSLMSDTVYKSGGLMGALRSLAAFEILLLATGLIWLAIGKVCGMSPPVWTIGSLTKKAGHPIELTAPPDMIIHFKPAHFLALNRQEAVALAGGILGALWLAAAIIAQVAFLGPTPFYWSLVFGALGVLAAVLILRKDPVPTPLWQLLHSRSGTALYASALAVKRSSDLVFHRWPATELTEEEFHALGNREMPQYFRVMATGTRVEWLARQGRMEEANVVAEAGALECLDLMKRSNAAYIQIALTTIALDMVLLGTIDRAREINAVLSRTEHGSVQWEVLQAVLKNEEGDSEAAQAHFRRGIALLIGYGYPDQESRLRHAELLKIDFPAFAAITDEIFAETPWVPGASKA